MRRPWGWLFEGCETCRDTVRLPREAGLASVEVTPFTLPTAFAPIRARIAAVAIR